MKKLSIFIAIIFSMFLIPSCQKELNFEESQGTLKADSISNDCLPAVLNGEYRADSTLSLNNYIDVTVDVRIPGSYVIKSDTVNGYSFYGAGDFPAIGLNTARIYASGRPTAAGINTFVLSYQNNNSFCSFDVEVLPANVSPDAVITLGGSGSTCTGFSLSGTYMQGLATNVSNNVTLNITVTTPGLYNISTPTVNGVSFSGSGTVSSSSSTITLTASGTPATAGSFSYTVTAGSSTCTFSVTFDPASSPATFTLESTAGACTNAVISGTYTAAIPVDVSNIVTISVNVTAIGTYTINTPTVNGISFSGSGVFTTTGVQTVNLTASGTPTTYGTFDYIITGAGSTCTISVNVGGAPTDYITCKLDGQFTTFNYNSQTGLSASAGLDNSAGFPILSIDGSTIVTSSNPSIHLQVGKTSGGSILPGTYNVNQISSGFLVLCDYYDNTSAHFNNQTDPNNQTQTPGFTITITSITATRCAGTFEGVIYENSGAGPGYITVTEGVFNVPF